MTTVKIHITAYYNERIEMYTLKVERGNETEVEGFETYNDMHQALLKCLVELSMNKIDYEVKHITL